MFAYRSATHNFTYDAQCPKIFKEKQRKIAVGTGAKEAK
jgi:hypothetical protein